MTVFVLAVFCQGAFFNASVALSAPMSPSPDARSEARPQTIYDRSQMVPHRGLYKMTLLSAGRGSGIQAASGIMAYRFSDDCDGWASETNVYLKVSYDQGEDVETNWTFASWEAKNGESYRFWMRQSRNGEELEVLKGAVNRKDSSSSAQAVFSIPADTRIDLPENFLFPTRHLIEVLKANNLTEKSHAYQGVSYTVFDGASLENPYEINAIVTTSKRQSVVKPEVYEGSDNRLVNNSSARALKHVRLAFFPVASLKAMPEFELTADYRSDGIAEYILQDFDNFSLELKPQKIELLKPAKC